MTARPTTVRVAADGPAPTGGVLPLLAGAVGLGAAAALLWWSGSAIPGPGSFDQRGLLDWIRTADPVVVAVAAIRLAGLALAAWIAVTGTAATIVHGTRLRRRRWLRRLVDRACFPVVRRLVHAATGTLLVAAALVPGTGAGAAVREAPAPVAVTAPALPGPGEVARLRPLTDDGPAAAPLDDGPDDGPGARLDSGRPTSLPSSAPGTTPAAPAGDGPDVASLRPLAEPASASPGAPAPASPVPEPAEAPPTTAPLPTSPDPRTSTLPSPATTDGAPGRPSTGPPPSAPAPGEGPPAETAVLRSLDPAPTTNPYPVTPSSPTAPPSAPAAPKPAPDAGAARSWTIAPGEHLWHVAEATLTAKLGAPADVPTIARYLDALIAANRDRLVLPDDPDLVFAGQVLVLPDPAGALG